MEGLLSSFMAPEQLVGADRYRCDACKALVDADCSLRVLSPPAHLILSLKRFSYDLRTQTRRKLCTAVRVSPSVQLQCEEGQEGAENGVATYDLYCTVVHRGASAGQGHYYCVGRHSNHSQAAAGSSGSAADGVPSLPSYSSPLSPWWCLNDHVVTSFEDVSAFEERDTPYILFYKRRQAAGGPIQGRTRGRCACATPPCAPGQLKRTKTYCIYVCSVYNAETETVYEYRLKSHWHETPKYL